MKSQAAWRGRGALTLVVLSLVAAGVAQGATGDLSGPDCLSGDNATGAGGTSACALIAPATAGGVNSGLDAPQTVAISPDGQSIYVAAQQDDAIVHFERNPTTGVITFEDCITGESASGPLAGGGNDACEAGPATTINGTGSGFNELNHLVISANGNHVYAASQSDEAVSHLTRNSTTGELTFVSCLTGDTAAATGSGGPCTALPSATASGQLSGLNFISGIAISPGGTNLYATASGDDAIAEFDRIPATGAISFAGCISANSNVVACAPAPTTSANGDDTGLDQAFAPVVSGDGNSVYATGSEDASVVWFDRAPGGALTFEDCITGETAAGPAPTGNDACSVAIPGATLTGTASGLLRIQTLAASPDDGSLYAGSQLDDAVSHFDRDPVTGEITFVGCIGADTTVTACSPAPLASSTGEGSGFDAVQSVTVSPDGKSVYAAGIGDDSIITFDRSLGDGTIDLDRCVTGDTAAGPAGTGACDASPPTTVDGVASGLDGMRTLTVSPDGAALIGVAENDDSLVSAPRAEAPQTTLDTAPSTATDDPTADFTFSADEAPVTFECSVDGEAFGTCSGAGAHTTAALPDGPHTFAVRARNDASPSAADPTPASVSFTVDTVPPQTSIASGPEGLTASTTAQFTFAATEAGTFACRIDGGAFTPCTSPRTYNGLGEGAHTFEVHAIDDAGNVDPSPASRSFTVDASAPDTTITVGPTGAITTRDVQFEFTAAGAASGFDCRVDGAPFTPCTSPQSYTGLPDGNHTFEVRAKDAAGNVDGSPAARSFSIDTVRPDTSITTAPKKTVRTDKDKKKATFRFITTEPAAFECKRDKGKDFKPCTAPYKKKYKRGKHTFTVRAVDEAGNVGVSDSHTWKVKRKK